MGILAIGAWTSVLMSVLMFSVSIAGLLRVDESTEKKGLDKVEFGQKAYRMSSMSIGRKSSGESLE